VNRRLLSVGVAATLAIVLAGCVASGARETDRSASLRVLAAASLANVFPRIGDEFSERHPGVRIDFAFAGTDALAAQIERGVPADVFAGASGKFGDQLATKHLIDDWRPFCTNRLVLVVPSSNPAAIRSPRDLAKPGVKLVAGAESVPIGSYTHTVLGDLDTIYGSGYEPGVLANLVSEEDSVEGVLTKVRLGEADAGFVYLTDARAAGPDVGVIAVPSEAQAMATYPIAVVRSSRRTTLAGQFVDFVLGPLARRELSRAGFGPPPTS
jgi:molybdate transport system substrate-binding protein